MAENRLKTHIRRILRSCKSKDQISDDVVETRQQPYQLVSPLPYFSSPFLSPHHVNGRKCPPTSPIIYSPLTTSSRESKKKTRKPPNKKGIIRCNTAYDKHTRYNALFINSEEDERASLAVEDSLAVVKRSSDPYSDFKTSMVEMIVENQMFAAEDLENLLRSFLSLNSCDHHNVIIQVFAEIWEALLL